MLYWCYKSTNIEQPTLLPSSRTQGTQFTCFTGTKVQILTLLPNASGLACSSPPSNPHGGAWLLCERYPVYLIYWYKSTNTDAAAWLLRKRISRRKETPARSILVLLPRPSLRRGNPILWKQAAQVCLQVGSRSRYRCSRLCLTAEVECRRQVLSLLALLA